ncbi:MAG: DUF1848 family protein [bacterium]
MDNLSWVDFSRRNDPAHPKGVEMLKKRLKYEGIPKVFCFWTKAPNRIATLYRDIIMDLKKEGTLVLVQATINHYHEMENIQKEWIELDNLVDLLGNPKQIRLRFDPIIVGYTKPSMFQQTIDIANIYEIDRIITNFLVPDYKGVGKLLSSKGFNIKEPTEKYKVEVLSKMLEMSGNIDLAVCAESAYLQKKLPQLKMATCSDPRWAIKLRPDLGYVFTLNPSRKGCGCCYSDDWGEYRSQGGYSCPHQCLYCYAK